MKRRLVHAGLLVFTLWPLVQLALVQAYDANPWKLAGWGMYAAPQITAELRVTGLTPDAVGEYPIRRLPETAAPVADRFLARRLALGRLVAPRALGQALLDEWPTVRAVRIEVVQPVLDPRTGHIRDVTSSYTYARE